MNRFKIWFNRDVGWETIFLLFLLIIALVGGFFIIRDGTASHQAKITCVTKGYPDKLYVGGIWYCHKLENGNDVIVPVSKVESELILE